MKVNRVKQPPGGWHFMVAEGVLLRASLESDLQKQIFEYRMRNNIPVGDIERDIDDYYCGKWPESCNKEPSDYPKAATGAVSPSRESMANRVSRWVSQHISSMPRGGHALASAADAHKRASICAGCNQNIPWQVGCPGCLSNVKTLTVQLKKMRTTPYDSALHSCQVGGWDNGAAVHLSKNELPATDGQLTRMPDRCWRKAL